MIKAITVRQTGPSIYVTIPREIAERLNLERGDQLLVVELAEGVLLTPYDPTLEDAMEAYGRVAKQYRGALRRFDDSGAGSVVAHSHAATKGILRLD